MAQPFVVQGERPCAPYLEFETRGNSMKGTLTCVTLALVLAAAAEAQVPVAGKWQGTTRNGMHVVLDLKAAGQVLTGTLTRDGEPSTITEGKVSKSTVTFKAILGEQEEALTGQLDGEQLRVWLDRQGPDGAVDFKRLKE
jgi:hypothetical protein